MKVVVVLFCVLIISPMSFAFYCDDANISYQCDDGDLKDFTTAQEYNDYFRNYLQSSSFDVTSKSELVTFLARICRCRGKSAFSSQARSCVNRIAGRLQRLRARSNNDNSYGFNLKDSDYVARNKQQLGSNYEIPEVLKSALPDPSAMRQVAQQNGWKAIEYASTSVLNPPNRSRRRLLIHIPGGNNGIDRWIQFTQPEPGTNNTERLVDMIAMDKSKSPSVPYFRQFWRDSSGKNPRERTSSAGQGHGTGDKCISCHPNGMRDLAPMPGTVPVSDLKTLSEMRGIMDGYNSPAQFGPLDGSTPPQSLAFNREMSGPKLGPPSCTGCHNDTYRSAFRPDMDLSHIKHKMRNDYSMPAWDTGDAQKYLEGLSKLIENKTMVGSNKLIRDELYSYIKGYSSNNFTRALAFMKRSDIPASIRLSQEKYDDYVAELSKMRQENASHETSFTKAAINREVASWMVDGCVQNTANAAPPANVNNSNSNDGTGGQSGAGPNSGAGGAGAGQ